MIAKIIPLRKMPSSMQELDYVVPKELETVIVQRQLVEIPFRAQTVFGVVNSLQKTSNFDKTKLKKIKQISVNAEILSVEQMNFLVEMSLMYKTPLATLVKMNLLPLKKRKIGKLELKKTVDNKQEKNISKPLFVQYTKLNEIEKYLENNIVTSKTNLILVPEISDIARIGLDKLATKKSAIITSATTEKQLFDIWVKIWNRELATIIGTRRALFLPFSSLDNIFVIDEANSSYKSWDMAPRYHTRDAILVLSQQHKSKVHLLGHTPSVETYFFYKKGIYDFTNLSKNISSKKMIKLIDLKNEKRKGNKSSISEELEKKLLTTNGDVLLYLNRKGSASFIACRECMQEERCEKCKNLFVFHENTNNLHCHYCNVKKTISKQCSHCGGTSMMMTGVGTQQAEKETRKIVGGLKQIIRIDSDNNKEVIQNNNEKIIIGTQLAFGIIDWSKIGLVAFIDADSSLFVPEYKVNENLWYLINDARNRTKDAEIIVQTAKFDNLVFQSLNIPSRFYTEELGSRKLFSYPPFFYLLKIYTGQMSSELAKQKASKLQNTLSTLTKNNTNVNISSFIEASPHYYKGKYWVVLLAKIKYNHYKRDIKQINSALDDDWKVDPNPNTILKI